MIKEYMNHILEAFDEAICISDAKGVITYVNTSYESLMHTQKEKVLGRHVSDLVKSGAVDMVLWPEVIRTQAPVSMVQNLDFGKRILLQGYPIIEDDKVRRW